MLDDWRDALGLGGLDPAVGLAEAEPVELTAALDLEPLGAYLRAVHDVDRRAASPRSTRPRWRRPPTAPAGSPRPASTEAAVPWLYRMWADKPAAWFVQWEAIGHRVNHLGEMVSVRNRLGLSPF